jgi:predicted MFS family arabinose efflux permease
LSELQVSPRRVRLAVGLLTAAVGVEFFHRQLLAIALEPLRSELGLSDTRAGLLVFGFSAGYAVFALILGRLADRGSRRNIYAAGIAVWGVATALGAVASGFLFLLTTRLLVGAAQGASGACNGPLLADYVRPERRSGAMALVNVGAALGVVGALTLGGYATDALGWRAAFAWSGIAGVAFAAIFAGGIAEPPRGWSEGRDGAAGERPSLRAVLGVLRASRALRHTLLASMLANTALLAGAQWGPAFFMRAHHMGLSDAGLFGGLAALCAVGGAVAGGVIADRAWVRSAGSVLRLPAWCLVLAAPLGFAAYAWPGPLGALAFLVVSTGLAMIHSAPVGAAFQALAPLRMRALVSGVINAALVLVASGGGPLLTGWLSDALDPAGSGGGLGRALSLGALLYLWAALHLWLAARSFVQDLERARRD